MGIMKSENPEFAPFHCQHLCIRPDTVILPIIRRQRVGGVSFKRFKNFIIEVQSMFFLLLYFATPYRIWINIAGNIAESAILPAILLISNIADQQYCQQYCWKYCWQYCWFSNIDGNNAGNIADYSTILLDSHQYCWQYCQFRDG